ncbi:hypothetical protein MIDIC_340027 [Alphaproteobacteria bacterium]
MTHCKTQINLGKTYKNKETLYIAKNNIYGQKTLAGFTTNIRTSYTKAPRST